MDRIMKSILLIFILTTTLCSFGQISVSAGGSILNNFGSGREFIGFSLGGEYALDDESSYFGRLNFYPGVKNRRMDSVLLQPYDIAQPFAFVNALPKTSYFSLEGGARYYIGDGYEYGFSGYGGYKVSILHCKVKLNTDEFDETKYRFPDNYGPEGALLALTVGIGAGIKYSIGTVGTVYLDGSIDYPILSSFTNRSIEYTDYLKSLVFFSLNIGFRKDLYWN